MNTPNTFNRLHHWVRGANAMLLLGTNKAPDWWAPTVDIHGEVYYCHSSSSTEDDLVVKSSPFFLPYPKRINNNFLRHLCLISQLDIQAFLSFQLQCHVASGGERDDWLRHTKDIIVKFLENSERLSSRPENFWGSRRIAATYRHNTYTALKMLGTSEFACES